MRAEVSQSPKFIDKFIKHTQAEGQLRILDIGCGDGESALRLARLGHQVMGISIVDREIEHAKRRAKREGATGCTFEVMDARQIADKFDRGFFQAVLISDMLHLIDKDDSRATLESAKDLTAPAGLHAVHGYLVDPHQSSSRSNIDRMFHPGELRDTYSTDPHWQVVDSSEDAFSAHQYNDTELVSSHASVIARKS